MSNMNEDVAEVRARNKELQRCVREEHERAERLLAENQRLREACRIYRDASIQSHDGHWDMQMTRGANCPECIRANELRDKADAMVRENDRLKTDQSLPHMGTVGDGGKITWYPPLKG